LFNNRLLVLVASLSFCWAGSLWFFQGMKGDIPVFEFLVGMAAIVYIWRVITGEKNN